MMKVLHSFNMGRGYLVDLDSVPAGLPAGTMLRSTTRPFSWKVQARVIYNHTISKQIVFEGETTRPMMLSFATIKNMEESAQKILEKEKQNIFTYWLDLNGEKPIEGEILEIANN